MTFLWLQGLLFVDKRLEVIYFLSFSSLPVFQGTLANLIIVLL